MDSSRGEVDMEPNMEPDMMEPDTGPDMDKEQNTVPLQEQLEAAERTTMQGGDLVRTLGREDNSGGVGGGGGGADGDRDGRDDEGDGASSIGASVIMQAATTAPITALTTVPMPARMTHGERVAHLRERAKTAQGVAQYLGGEDVRSPVIKTLLLVCEERLAALRAARDVQDQAIQARRTSTIETLRQVLAYRQASANTRLQAIQDAWFGKIGPALLECPECKQHDVWCALVQDILVHGKSSHASDFVADVRVAISEARRQVDDTGVAGSVSGISARLVTVLGFIEDLDMVCAEYLDCVASWQAVATEAELAVVDATAQACAKAAEQEFYRRSARVLATCEDAIMGVLAKDLGMTAAGTEIQLQHTKAAQEALRSRAAFELATMEMCVFGLETPWRSTLQGNDTQLSPPPISRLFQNGRTTTGM